MCVCDSAAVWQVLVCVSDSAAVWQVLYLVTVCVCITVLVCGRYSLSSCVCGGAPCVFFCVWNSASVWQVLVCVSDSAGVWQVLSLVTVCVCITVLVCGRYSFSSLLCVAEPLVFFFCVCV